MKVIRFNLRNVAVVAVCLAGLAVFSGCEKPENLIVGKWVASDSHAGGNDTIVFTENFYVEKYFDCFSDEGTSFIVTYTLSDDGIVFTVRPYDLTNSGIEYFPYSETFKYILKKNSLTIKGFSNPFFGTEEMKRDVRFKKVK